MDVLRETGRFEEAGTVGREILDTGPMTDRRGFALYLAAANVDVESAAALAREELEERADPYTYQTLAWAQRMSGKFEAARINIAKALSTGMKDARLLYHAGVISAGAGAYDEAEAHLEHALSLQHMLLPSERADLRVWKERVQQSGQIIGLDTSNPQPNKQT